MPLAPPEESRACGAGHTLLGPSRSNYVPSALAIQTRLYDTKTLARAWSRGAPRGKNFGAGPAPGCMTRAPRRGRCGRARRVADRDARLPLPAGATFEGPALPGRLQLIHPSHCGVAARSSARGRTGLRAMPRNGIGSSGEQRGDSTQPIHAASEARQDWEAPEGGRPGAAWGWQQARPWRCIASGDGGASGISGPDLDRVATGAGQGV